MTKQIKTLTFNTVSGEKLTADITTDKNGVYKFNTHLRRVKLLKLFNKDETTRFNIFKKDEEEHISEIKDFESVYFFLEDSRTTSFKGYNSKQFDYDAKKRHFYDSFCEYYLSMVRFCEIDIITGKGADKILLDGELWWNWNDEVENDGEKDNDIVTDIDEKIYKLHYDSVKHLRYFIFLGMRVYEKYD